ncbi:MAG TPA: MBG domain-containing protein [Geobacteraceae bacterium]
MRGKSMSGGSKWFLSGAILGILLLLMASAGWAAPTVTAFTPAEGSVAPLSTTVTATFSEAMNPATITSGSFTLSRFVGLKAVAGGYYHTVALKNDGTVVAWGDNEYGQCNVPAGLSGVVAVAAGMWYTVALKDNGTVVAWGDNDDHGVTTVPAGLSGVVAIASGSDHIVALKNDGTVVAWGYNIYGQTTVPTGLNGVIAVAAGGYHSVALKNDGSVVPWGDSSFGLNSVPPGLSGVKAIAAGGFHTVALKNDGTLVAWGFNNDGQITVPTGLSGVAAIAAGEYFTEALKNDGSVVAWGDNSNGQCNVPAGLTGVTAIAAGFFHSLALKNDGTMVGWGKNNYLQSNVMPGLSGVAAIAAGTVHTAVLKNDGTAAAWGDNIYGESTFPMGLTGVIAIAAGSYDTVALRNDGTVSAWGRNDNNQTVVPSGLSGVTAIAASWHTVALKNNGTVVAWGYNSNGQCTVPVGLSGVVAIAAGGFHTVALKNDGTVVAWGYNVNGQTSVPAGLSGVVAIAAGSNHTVALKNDGTVVAWGYNVNGQTSVPAGLSGVVAIAAGDYHTVALKNDGTIVAWGSNSNGQITVPAGLSGVAAIAAGGAYTIALKKDGTVVAWGYGQGGGAMAATSFYEKPIQGIVTYDQATNIATFAPSAPLEPDATYYGTLNTGARSTAGVHPFADYRWSFLTSGLAMATITLDHLIQPYDGTPESVTATTNPSGLPVVITYKADDGSTVISPTVPGKYHVDAAIVAPNYQHYQGSASAFLDITNAIVILDNLNQQYDGTPRVVTATTIPAGLSVVITYDGSLIPPIAVGSYKVVARADGPGYHGIAIDTLNVAKGTPTITWANPADITYGTSLSGTQLNAVANVPGTFTYTPALGTVLNVGSGQTLAVNFTPTDTANNNSVTKSIIINVAKATPTISWTNPADITYGTLLSGTQLNAVANVPGTITYTPASGIVLDAGSGQTLTANFTPTDTANYNCATKSVTINVAKITPIITWANSADIIYGTPLTVTQLNAIANVPGTFTYTPALGTLLNAGSGQTLTVNFTPTDTAKYNSVTKTVIINVAKAIPIISWTNPADITYGTPLSGMQLSAVASVPGTITYTPASGTVLNAGSGQTLTANFTPTDTANYNSAANGVTINVGKAMATVTLPGLNQVYDGTPKAVTATTSPPGLSVGITYNGNATAPTAIGRYDVVATISDPNYQGSASGTLSIAVKVTLGNLSQTYDGTPKAATATTNPAGIPFVITYNDLTTAPTDAGSYPNVVATITDPRYDGSATGTLVVAKAVQSVQSIALSATSSSGLPVTYALTPGSPGTIDNADPNQPILRFTGPGTIEVTASQAGNNNYNAASEVKWTIVVP